MADSQMDPGAYDPKTDVAQPVTELGVERDGFRGHLLVTTVGMATEDTGWTGRNGRRL